MPPRSVRAIVRTLLVSTSDDLFFLSRNPLPKHWQLSLDRIFFNTLGKRATKVFGNVFQERRHVWIVEVL